MIFPPFPEPGFRKLSDLQSGIDSYYTADQLKKYGLKCVEEYKRCQSKQEWDIRGDLASSLKCWHRLTGAEAAELVEFTRDRLEGAQPVREPSTKSEAAEMLAHAWQHHTGAEPSESLLAQSIDNAVTALSQPVREHLSPDVVRALWQQTLDATKGPLPIEEFATVLAKHYGIGVSK